MSRLLFTISLALALPLFILSTTLPCTPFVDSDCSDMDVDFVADPCDDSCFFTCELRPQTRPDDVIAGGMAGVKRCCNHCESWSQALLTCVYRDDNPDCDFRPTTEEPVGQSECLLMAGPNPYTFLINGTQMNCPMGTSYNVTACTCQLDPSNPLRMDAQITCITFDNGWDNLQPSHGVYARSSNVEVVRNCGEEGGESGSDDLGAGNCGYFNSSAGSSMEIPMFSNAMDSFDQFSVSFFMKRDFGVHGVKGVLTNGDCGSESSFDVLSLDNELSVTLRNSSDAMVSTGQFRNFDGEFTHVAVVYDSDSVTTYLGGEVVSVLAFQGRVKRVYHHMIIGATLCQAEGKYFQGYLDTISFAKVAFSPAQVKDLADNREKCLPTV